MIITNEALKTMIDHSVGYPLSECKIERVDDLKFTFIPPEGTEEKTIEIDLWHDKCAFSLNGYSSLFDFSELECVRDLIKSLKTYYGIYIDPLQETLEVKEQKKDILYQFYRETSTGLILSSLTVELVGSDFFLLGNDGTETLYSYNDLLEIIVLKKKTPKGFCRHDLISICKSVRTPWRFYKDFNKIWEKYF
jgi:hypothetical protein